MKTQLLLVSGQILYMKGYPAYALQDIRKSLDYIIQYKLKYEEHNHLEHILGNELQLKSERYPRHFCIDQNKLMYENRYNIAAFFRSKASDPIPYINYLLPRAFLLNYSTLHMLKLLSKALFKLSSISSNIGLLHYSDYYGNILRLFAPRTTQPLRLIKHYFIKEISEYRIQNTIPNQELKHDGFSFLNDVGDWLSDVSPIVSKVGTKQRIFNNANYKEHIKLLLECINEDNTLPSSWKNKMVKLLSKSSPSQKSLTKSHLHPKKLCSLLKVIILEPSKLKNIILLPDWSKTYHEISELRIFEYHELFLHIIEDQLANNFGSIPADEKFAFVHNLMIVLDFFIQLISPLHIKKTKKSLLLKNDLVKIYYCCLSVLQNQDLNKLFQQAIYQNSYWCDCCKDKIEIQHKKLRLNPSMNSEIDLFLTYTDVAFTYKHQIKSIRKVVKSRNGESRPDLKYLRKSIKHLCIGDKSTDDSDISFLLNFRKSKFERNRFSVKNPELLKSMNKMIGDLPIITLKFIRGENGKQCIFLSRTYSISKRNSSFLIDNPEQTNHLSDLLYDFSKIILNLEKDLENSRVRDKKFSSNNWWKERFDLDKRMETLLKGIENVLDYLKVL